MPTAVPSAAVRNDDEGNCVVTSEDCDFHIMLGLRMDDSPLSHGCVGLEVSRRGLAKDSLPDYCLDLGDLFERMHMAEQSHR